MGWNTIRFFWGEYHLEWKLPKIDAKWLFLAKKRLTSADCRNSILHGWIYCRWEEPMISQHLLLTSFVVGLERQNANWKHSQKRKLFLVYLFVLSNSLLPQWPPPAVLEETEFEVLRWEASPPVSAWDHWNQPSSHWDIGPPRSVDTLHQTCLQTKLAWLAHRSHIAEWWPGDSKLRKPIFKETSLPSFLGSWSY